jgi:hypothetical protein
MTKPERTGAGNVSGRADVCVLGCDPRCLSSPTVVTRGLDPRAHLLRERMDCRIKSGNDDMGQIEPATTRWTRRY